MPRDPPCQPSLSQSESCAAPPTHRSIKILSRKQENRAIVGTNGILAILMSLSPPLSPKIAAEGANALLNICYEPENVTNLLNTPGVQQLVGFLSDPDPDLQVCGFFICS